MGHSGSKRRSAAVTQQEPVADTDVTSGWNMDGPSFPCEYLGSSALSKPTTGIGVLQQPIKDLYLRFRKAGGGGRRAALKLTQQGLHVTLFEGGMPKGEMFYDFGSVSFIEALKFSLLRSSSEKKPKAIFVPVDESKGPVSDKNAFALEKSFHFLVQSAHPPLVACVLRRPKGVKALDCHVFALDTIENALHITALVVSMQTPNRPPSMELAPDVRGDGSFNRGTRGDVIRTEFGEYSVYRGQQGGFDPREDRSPMDPPDGGQKAPPGGWSYDKPVGGGDVVVARKMSGGQYSPDDGPPYGGRPPYDGGGYRRQEMDNRPDLIAHGRQRSGDNTEPVIHERSFSTGSDRSGGRGEDDRGRGGRLPSGTGAPSPRQAESPRYFGQPGAQFPPPGPTSPRGGGGGMVSPRSPIGYPPTSPIGGNAPVYSASNLESRVSVDDPREDNNPATKPVAKVPPHLKAGIKVLPSDFRAVKLKHNPQRSESEETNYDNNKEILAKYKEMQDRESDLMKEKSRDPRQEIMTSDPRDEYDFREEKIERYQETRSYSNNWVDSPNGDAGTAHVEMRRASGDKGDGYGNWGAQRHSQELRADPRDVNVNRYSSPVYTHEAPVPQSGRWDAGKSHSSYNVDSTELRSEGRGENDRKKDAEIADMFSNFRIQGNGRYQTYESNPIEEGLGYLP